MKTVRTYFASDDLVKLPWGHGSSLELPMLVVENVFQPANKKNFLVVKANVLDDKIPKTCPYCGSTNLIRSGYAPPRQIHDVPRSGYVMTIFVQPPRMYCKDCVTRYTVAIDGVEEDRQMTTRLRKFVEQECFINTITEVGRLAGLPPSTVGMVMDRKIEELDGWRERHPNLAPRVLGIDEKHIVDKMRGILVDVENTVLLDMLPTNDEDTMKAGIKKLDGWENIEVVTTDMNNSYLSWLRYLLPNATVVVDKFHVIQDVEQKITAIRKKIYTIRTDKVDLLRGVDMAEYLRQKNVLQLVAKDSRLFNYGNDTVLENKEIADKMATVMREFPEFLHLRKLYSYIDEMYAKTDYEEAKAVFESWRDLIPPTSSSAKVQQKWCDKYNLDIDFFPAFRTITRRMFQSSWEYILNYFKPGCRYTNSLSENFNRHIGHTDELGYGYSYKRLRAKMLYADLITTKEIYSVIASTIKPWPQTIHNGTMMRVEDLFGGIPKFEFTHKKVPVTILPFNKGDWLDSTMDAENPDEITEAEVSIADDAIPAWLPVEDETGPTEQK